MECIKWDPQFIYKIIEENHPDLVDRVNNFLISNKNPELSRICISEIQFNGNARGKMCATIKDLSGKKSWDPDGISRLAAIFALPKLCLFDEEIKYILRESISDENPVIRDATATVVQIYSGIVDKELVWGDGDGQLYKDIDLSLLD